LKIIDYGSATAPGSDEPLLYNEYCAPEVNERPRSFTVDLWGLGIIAFSLCIGTNPTTQWILQSSGQENGLWSLLQGVHPEAVQLLQGLLAENPADRVSIGWVKNWASLVEVPASIQVEAGPLKRWPYHNMSPQSFAAKLPPRWSRDGMTIGDLDLMQIGGVHVLLVDPEYKWRKVHTYDHINDRVTILYQNAETQLIQVELPSEPISDLVTIPDASTVLHAGSWIYFGVNSEDLEQEAVKCFIAEKLGLAEAHHRELCVLSRSESVSRVIPFMPEFLFFDFPDHCVNAILGPRKLALAEENALDLRRIFKINVAGIVHPDGKVSWWPGATRLRGGFVGAGDRALVMRAPQWDAAGLDCIGHCPTVRMEDIQDLMDAQRFQQRLGMKTAAWRTWQRNAGAWLPNGKRRYTMPVSGRAPHLMRSEVIQCAPLRF